MAWIAGRGDEVTDGIRVFLVDDHELVRRGLRDILEEHSEITIVGEAGTAGEAVAAIDEAAPDVVVLDVRLPDGSGVDVCREVRSRRPETRALMLTSFDDDAALFAAILAGASGYLLKQIRGEELATAVLRVADGQSLLDPAVTARVLERVRAGATSPTGLEQLSGQERRILALVAEGMTNRQIAERLFLSEKTVKNYVSSLLAKLGLSRRTQAAVFATMLQRSGQW